MIEYLGTIRKAIVGLLVPLIAFLIQAGVLPDVPEGQTIDGMFEALTAAITALAVWLIPNKDPKS